MIRFLSGLSREILGEILVAGLRNFARSRLGRWLRANWQLIVGMTLVAAIAGSTFALAQALGLRLTQSVWCVALVLALTVANFLFGAWHHYPTERRQLVARLLAHVCKEIRYTGIEFGSNAIVPVRPETAYERGFGDCKDQATLLVGLLRAVGIDAHVSLLRPGTGRDVEPTLPGMGLTGYCRPPYSWPKRPSR